MNVEASQQKKTRWYGFLFSSSPLLVFLFLGVGIGIFFFISRAGVAFGDFLIYQRGDRVGMFMLLFVLPFLLFVSWRLANIPTGVFSSLRLRWVLAGAVLLSLPLFFLPPLVSRDAYYSLYYGQTTAAGANPYTTTIGHRFVAPYAAFNDEIFYDFPSPYGPLWNLYASVPVTFFGNDVSSSLLFLRCVSLLALLATGALIFRIGGRAGGWGAKAAALFVWNPAVLIFAVNEMHNDIFLAFFLALFVLALHRRLFILAALALLVGGLIKWVPLLLLPLVLVAAFRERPRKDARRTAVFVGVLSVFVVFMSFLPFWEGQNLFQGLVKQGALFNYTFFVAQGAFFLGSLHNVQSLLAKGLDLFTIPSVAIAKIAGLLLFLWVVPGILLRYFRRRLEATEAAYTLLLLFLVLCLSWLMYWYILWFFPLAASSRKLMKLTTIFSLFFWVGLFNPLVVVLPMYVIFALGYYLVRKSFFRASSRPPPALQEKRI